MSSKVFFNQNKRAFIVQGVWISCHIRLRFCDSWTNWSRTSRHMRRIPSGRTLSFFFSSISYTFPYSFLRANVQSERFLLEWHVDGIRSRWSSSSPLRCETEAVWNMDGYPQFALKLRIHNAYIQTKPQQIPPLALHWVLIKAMAFLSFQTDATMFPFWWKRDSPRRSAFTLGFLAFKSLGKSVLLACVVPQR